MEEEKYLTGYCRQLDGARTVEVIVTNGQLTEADCAYGSCPFQSVCSLAKEMDEIG